MSLDTHDTRGLSFYTEILFMKYKKDKEIQLCHWLSMWTLFKWKLSLFSSYKRFWKVLQSYFKRLIFLICWFETSCCVMSILSSWKVFNWELWVLTCSTWIVDICRLRLDFFEKLLSHWLHIKGDTSASFPFLYY